MKGDLGLVVQALVLVSIMGATAWRVNDYYAERVAVVEVYSVQPAGLPSGGEVTAGCRFSNGRCFDVPVSACVWGDYLQAGASYRITVWRGQIVEALRVRGAGGSR